MGVNDMVEKLERDGKVAVLYSPGFGAGWSSWNTDIAEELVFDKDLILALERGGPDEVEKVAIEKYEEDHYFSCYQLKIEWITKGVSFYIQEYDGSERIVYPSDALWMVA